MATYKLNIQGSSNVKVYVNDVLVPNRSSYNFTSKDTMTFKADKGFYFDKAIEFEDELGGIVSYDLSNDGYNADFTECIIMGSWFNSRYIDLNSTITVSTGILKVKGVEFTLNVELENARIFINDKEIFHGENVIFNDETDYFKFMANEGYYFNRPIEFTDELGGIVSYDLSNDGYNADFTECIIMGSWLAGHNIDYTEKISAKAVKIKKPPEEPPIENIENDYISVYTLSQEQLNKLSSTLYEIRQGDSTAFLDIGYYMNNLYILPFNIDGIISDVLTKIKLGGVVLDVYSREINKSNVTIDLGVITVPLKYNNVYDFINTECNIYLPYAKKITLDTSYVIGQDLRFEYVINLYTQETTINIYSSITNKIVYSDSIEVGYKIPFVQKVNYDMAHKFDYNLQNKIDTPYIEIVRKKPYPNKYIDESRFTRLNNETGYLKVDEINLETTATLQEQEEIKILLKQGVYIK